MFVISCCFALSGFSQIDSGAVADSLRKPIRGQEIINRKDTTTNLKTASESKPTIFKDSARLALERLPKIAIRRSALVPGWGQVTNKRWWKVPIIYGGFVGLGLIFEFNQRYYKQFLSELQFRDANPGQVRDSQLVVIQDQQGLIRYKDYYRRTRDLSVLGILGLYTINIIDAYVDAKFFRFDISDKLGLRVTPSLIPSVSHAYSSPVPAIRFQLTMNHKVHPFK
ncbi:MAG: hypothetical protein H7Y13_14715 [Sphingobacteriaceae bacterium]|nr:hypothetical protein [Sphingobacteriaceae bacterium]